MVTRRQGQNSREPLDFLTALSAREAALGIGRDGAAGGDGTPTPAPVVTTVTQAAPQHTPTVTLVDADVEQVGPLGQRVVWDAGMPEWGTPPRLVHVCGEADDRRSTHLVAWVYDGRERRYVCAVCFPRVSGRDW